MVRAMAPGLLVVTLATGAAFGLAQVVPDLNSTTAAVILGAVLTNLGGCPPATQPGLRFASHRLLRTAVVLLGLQLSVGELLGHGGAGLVAVVLTVAVTFLGTRALGRILGLPPARHLLIATGFSICGASAIAAMRPVARGDDDDTAIAIALVTLCGSLAIFVLPLLQAPLGLDPAAFGAWVGASVHDVGQTVATANRVPGALDPAVVIKLTRVMMLAPLVAIMVVVSRRGTGLEGGHRPPPLPLFVGGFLAAVGVASTGILPDGVLHGAEVAQSVLLTAALVGLGTGIRLALLRRTGGRSLVLGLTSWVLVAAIAYLGVRLVGA